MGEEISLYDVGNEVKGGGSEKAGAAAESARHPDELKQDEKWVLSQSSPGSSYYYDFGYGYQTVVPYASRGH
jgi:hypothetical protein